MIRAEVVHGFDTLESWRHRWDEIFRARAHEPSSSFEWTSALARHHVRAGDECLLMCLRRGAEVVGLVPLVARKATLRMGVRATVLAPLSEYYNTHSDLLLADTDEETVDAFVAGLNSLGVAWDSFSMARLLEQSPIAASLQRVLKTRACRHSIRDGMPAYVLPLPSSYGEYLKSRSAKFRNYLRRVEKRLESAGATDVREVRSASDLDEALDALLQVEQASWKHEHGSSIAAIDRQARFYTDFARGAQAAGRLHLQWMQIDSKPAAYNLGYVHGGRYHYLKTSFDRALGPLGPATFLRARLIESLIRRGLSEFDFPGEPYEWEAQWTDQVRWRRTLAVYRSTMVGRLLALSSRLRHRPRPRKVEHADPRAISASGMA
jgi:CelD/BcsL family acetyltransferase involved in cellulose biosynthesis